MRRRDFVAAAGATAATVAVRVGAQGPKSMPRVSFLSHASPNTWGHLLDEFRAGLRALGYNKGVDLQIDLWWAENRLDRIPALIREAARGEMLLQ